MFRRAFMHGNLQEATCDLLLRIELHMPGIAYTLAKTRTAENIDNYCVLLGIPRGRGASEQTSAQTWERALSQGGLQIARVPLLDSPAETTFGVLVQFLQVCGAWDRLGAGKKWLYSASRASKGTAPVGRSTPHHQRSRPSTATGPIPALTLFIIAQRSRFLSLTHLGSSCPAFKYCSLPTTPPTLYNTLQFSKMCPPTEETTNGQANGTNGAPRSKEGFTGVQTKQNPHPSHRSPYQPVGDFLSNVGRFKIIGAFRMPTFTATRCARVDIRSFAIEHYTRAQLTYSHREHTERRRAVCQCLLRS